MTRLPGLPVSLYRVPTPASLLREHTAALDYPPTEAEQQELRAKGLLGSVLGGVAAAANTLDAPGSFVRGKLHGALTGDWSKGPQNVLGHEGRVYGSDLLTDITGWKPPETWSGEGYGFNASNAEKLAHAVAGFVTDLVTDPLALVSPFGRTSKALAKIAQVGPEAAAASRASRGVGRLTSELEQAVMSGAMKEDAALKAAMNLPDTAFPKVAPSNVPLNEAVEAYKLAPGASTIGTIGKEVREGERALLTVHAPWWTGMRRKLPQFELGVRKEVPGIEHVVEYATPKGPMRKVIEGEATQALQDQLNAALASMPGATLISSTPTTVLKNSALANKAADLADFLAYNPAMRVARGLFSPAVYQSFSKEKQRARDALYVMRENLMGNVEEAGRISASAYDDIAKTLEDITGYAAANGNTRVADDLMRSWQEHGFDDQLKVLRAMQTTPGMLPYGPTTQEVQELAARIGDWNHFAGRLKDWAHAEFNKAGGAQAELDDFFIQHFPRSSSIAAAANAARIKRSKMGWKDTADASEYDPKKARHELARDIPEGETLVNFTARDHTLQGFDNVPVDPTRYADYQTALQARDWTRADAIIANSPETRLVDLSRNATGKKIPLHQRDDWHLMLEKALEQDGIISAGSGSNLSIPELRGLLLHERYAKPALERELRNLNLTTPNLATGAMDVARDASGNVVSRTVRKGTNFERTETAETLRNHWSPAAGEKGGLAKLLKYTDMFGAEKLEKGIYDQNMARDLGWYVRGLMERTATLRSAHDWLSRDGIVAAGIAHGVPLPEAWRQSGLSEPGIEAFLKNHPILSQQLTQQQNAALAAAPSTPGAAAQAVKDATKAFAEGLDVHPAAVGGLKAYAELAEAANATNKRGPLAKALDQYTTAWREMQYTMWPSSYTRNLISAASNAIFDGRGSVANIIGGMTDTYRTLKDLAKGGAVPDWLKRFEEQKIFRTFALEDILRNPNLLGSRKRPTGGLLHALNPMQEGRTWKPWAIPGFFGYSEEAIAAGKPLSFISEAGHSLQSLGDFVAQAGHFKALLKAGYSDVQAAHIIRDVHYLTKRSPFETHLARWIPFERFSARNIPYQLKKLLSDPGGPTAQVVRGMNEATIGTGEEVYIPEWMRERTVMPWGKNTEGLQGYFSTTALPQSELNDIVFGRGPVGNITRTIEKVGLAKVLPLFAQFGEQWWNPETGTQFYTGRKIADLEKPLEKATGIPYSDPVVRYLTPFGRALSEVSRFPGLSEHGTISQLLANMAGMGKVSYYDADKWRRRDIEQALERDAVNKGALAWRNYFIPGAPTKSRPWTVPDSTASRLSPEQLADLRQTIRRRMGLHEYGVHVDTEKAARKRAKQSAAETTT